jgi:hypothetical protein
MRKVYLSVVVIAAALGASLGTAAPAAAGGGAVTITHYSAAYSCPCLATSA